MFTWLGNVWRVPELRRRLLFTAGVLAVYRLGSWLPAPGVDQAADDQPEAVAEDQPATEEAEETEGTEG